MFGKIVCFKKAKPAFDFGMRRADFGFDRIRKTRRRKRRCGFAITVPGVPPLFCVDCQPWTADYENSIFSKAQTLARQ
jgi:hypothetical protein